MSDTTLFPLDAIRTDGWFERIGESVGSFQALCDIIGERFFAFSMITGARITALTVDRRNPDNTLVDFTVGGADQEATGADTQRLTLANFRRRLVSALVAEEPSGPAPERATDTEAIQRHVGVRYLLLAPLYGYSLLELDTSGIQSGLRLLHDGVEETHALESFRLRLRAHIRDDLERASRGVRERGAIDLSRVALAEEAANTGNHERVLELLGAWPAPLTIFLRTPDGQMLPDEKKRTIARGLVLLGAACVALGDVSQGEEVLRLGIQYAGESPTAGDCYARLGEALLEDDRAGEAIGPLRRAANLGGEPKLVWVLLTRAFCAQERSLAALGAMQEALEAGVDATDLDAELAVIEKRLGDALPAWRALVESKASV